ncbi:peptidyl-tRNA hydrolase PTRHD1, putative [Plasmodium ovale curtisi]|uniref:peptidyl-tRNA hydrolase n=1 Tax=Plasmodium ovale curtisi TaxID=864141 RepID=A0A1A8WS87_PLAOA|nr:peptidyl-tRNA hydrolase PTRHD1, putative [Plasmodium ovale curtisi]SBS95170.1 peptidyl-tRNA hydrolase PTRHD1, putative [Plasmodium ovale curtisi]
MYVHDAGKFHSIAVIAENFDDQVVKEYVSPENINNMHKVILKIDDTNELKNLASILDKESMKYRIWTEYPDNVMTALAVKPYYKITVKNYFKKYALLKKL